ncbi:protein BASIC PENTACYSTEINE2-like [Punica granatum]|uniref:Protein BASIC PENTACYSTEINE2-like n=2 Tax=Punica granatum TaxID=22663 RepID=A0A6P8EA61_PUNGR|nr:protein BASIC PENTACYSTEINE2-like [Punica granatum]PKI53489.1 hypothetical protein CRG98_026179 [Punica granatum]
MDGDNGLNMRNWGYYDAGPAGPSLRSHLPLQLMSTMPEKPLLDTRAGLMGPSSGGPFQHHRDIGVSHGMFPMDFMRDPWISNREKFPNLLPVNHNYSMIPETSSTAQHHMQMVQPSDLVKEERGAMTQVDEVGIEMENNVNGPSKKRQQGPKAQKSPKPKKAKKGPRVPKPETAVATTPSGPRARTVKKTTEVMINGINMDISSIPIPVCSCTGTPQQCYRWGSGGWQSACCTTGLSMYPLPMSTKRRGARIAGRKMSLGAFKKVLEKHAAEGYNFANPIDLRTHWAKHGTNKFVTIR